MPTRRACLAAAGAGLAGALAGCSGGGGGDPTTTLPPDTALVKLVDYAFRPGTGSPLRIDAGTTVRFRWETGGHDIVVTRQPDRANWSGHESLERAGFTTEHAFEVPGRYHFYCTPHRSLGMVGDIVVEE